MNLRKLICNHTTIIIIVGFILCLVHQNIAKAQSLTWTEAYGPIYEDGIETNQHSPALAMNSNDDAILSWYQYDADNNYRVFVSFFNSGTETWSTPTIISNLSYDRQARAPEVAFNDDGEAAVIWIQHDGTSERAFVNIFNGTSWLGATMLDDDINTYDAEGVGISMSDSSTIIAVWSQNDSTSSRLYTRVYQSENWSEKTILDNGTNNASGAQVAFDIYGYAIVTWLQKSTDDNYNIYLKAYNSLQNTWSAAKSVMSGTRYFQGNQVATNKFGKAMITWSQTDDTGAYRIYAKDYNISTGNFGTTATLDDGNNTNISQLPKIAYNKYNAVVAWLQMVDSKERVYAAYYQESGSGWGTPQFADNEATDNHLYGVALNENGSAMVLSNTNVIENMHVATYVEGTWNVTDALVELSSSPVLAMGPDKALVVFGDYSDGVQTQLSSTLYGSTGGTAITCPEGEAFLASCEIINAGNTLVCADSSDTTNKLIINTTDTILGTFKGIQGLSASSFAATLGQKSIVHIAEDDVTMVVSTAELATAIEAYGASSDTDFYLCKSQTINMIDFEADVPAEEPDYDPCAGKTCGDRCFKCELGDGDCVEAEVVLYCNARNQCLPNQPECTADVTPPEDSLPPEVEPEIDCPDNMFFLPKNKRCECIEKTEIVVMLEDGDSHCVDKEEYLNKKLEAFKKQKAKLAITDVDSTDIDTSTDDDTTTSTDADADAVDSTTVQIDSNETSGDEIAEEIEDINLENGVVGGGGGGGCSLSLVSQTSSSSSLIFWMLGLLFGFVRIRKSH